MTQNRALQLLFDLRYLSSTLGNRVEEGKSFRSHQDTRYEFSSHIDINKYQSGKTCCKYHTHTGRCVNPNNFKVHSLCEHYVVKLTSFSVSLDAFLQTSKLKNNALYKHSYSIGTLQLSANVDFVYINSFQISFGRKIKEGLIFSISLF